MSKQLHIISEVYPFGKGEQFFENEVIELSKYFDSIVIHPLSLNNQILRPTPKNVSVNEAVARLDVKVGKLDLIKNIRIILSILFLEFRKTKRKVFLLRNIKRLAIEIIQAHYIGRALKSQLNDDLEYYFHSFWMNTGALALAMLKNKKAIESFNFRVNGFDLFDERREGLYMPYRFFNLKMVEHVFAVSTEAEKYLKAINYYPNKVILSHNAVYDLGLNPESKDEVIRIVSCSNLIPLKRVDKIIDALGQLTFKVNWVHFGDGPLMTGLKLKATDLPKHIIWEFKGNKPHNNIMDLYRNKHITIFIHTSETEGQGMAIVEAQSFGIPPIAIGVGGVLDIVDNSTGVVLKPESGGAEIAKAITEFIEGEKNTSEFRKTTKNICLTRFEAEKTYKKLYQTIVSK